MITNFTELTETSKKLDKITVSVAAAQDKHVLKSIYHAYKFGIANAILVGRKEEILTCLNECDVPDDIFEIIDVKGDLKEQSEKAVEIVTEGKAQVIMKGLVDTAILLKAVLAEKAKLRTGRVMSSVGVMETSLYHKLLLVTDPGMNIKPGLEQKKQIIENAVQVANSLGNSSPKVAILCAKEKVNAKMQETIDAQELVRMNEQGNITNCIVGGPFALDNVVSKEAAIQKGLNHPVTGDADIILVPELVSGNVLYKSLVFLAGAKSAGIIVGAKAPIILTSRADSEDTKLNSIALAALMASKTNLYRINL